MKNRIFDDLPGSWRDLQCRVAQVFSEIGCDVAVEHEVSLPRGKVEVDVIVTDKETAPYSLYVCECKNWKKRVPKSVVHSFRTVVNEIGANRGLLISRHGFQEGAHEAARFTNVDLLSWREFEALLFDRWVKGITATLDPLFYRAFCLMDPNNEDLWNEREFSEALYNEWHDIGTKYQLIFLWSLCHWHSDMGIPGVLNIKANDKGVLTNGGEPIVFDSYRKLIEHAPALCEAAYIELQEFWGRYDEAVARRRPTRA